VLQIPTIGLREECSDTAEKARVVAAPLALEDRIFIA